MSFIASLVVCSVCGAAPESVPIKLPEGPHPCVYVTQEEVAQIRAKAETLDWAKALRAKTLKAADAFLGDKLDIPKEGAQWSHWYTCKKDGGRLKAKSPTEHVCSVCGEVYSGWPYDQVHINHRHSHFLGGINTLGLAYLLDPKPEYAAKARDVLLAYAAFYEDLEIHNVHGKKARPGARLFAQTLDEAVRLCGICQGYDMVYDAPCFSAEDHDTIANHFIRPMVDTIRTHPAGISNWQSWHNAGVACAGFVLRDQEYVDWAINDPDNGFLMQMRKSVLPSGMWYEGAPSYHWYALSSHLYLLETATRAGMDLYGIPIVRKMFEAPVRQLFPDLTFPAIQDSGRSSITGARSYYEVAYRRYGDPNYLGLLQPRDSVQALLWGADTVPEEAPPALKLATSNDASEGLAILRDADNATALFLDYGEKFGGHIQPGKLGIILFANGDERVVDPGRLPYGNPIHRGWYTQTLAHNTVVVNQASQRGAPGILKGFKSTDEWSVVRTACEKAYDGVTLDRTVALSGNTIVDVFRCTSQNEATFDLPLHFRGELAGLPEGSPIEPLAEGNGYNYLQNLRRLPEPVGAFTVKTGKDTSIHVSCYGGGEALVADAYGATPSELLPMVMRRQRGTNATFVTVFQVLGAKMEPENVGCDMGEAISITGPFELTVGDAVTVNGKSVF
jgi:oligo-alginate lyase